MTRLPDSEETVGYTSPRDRHPAAEPRAERVRAADRVAFRVDDVEMGGGALAFKPAQWVGTGLGLPCTRCDGQCCCTLCRCTTCVGAGTADRASAALARAARLAG